VRFADNPLGNPFGIIRIDKVLATPFHRDGRQ
jgi:hypothetical protein